MGLRNTVKNMLGNDAESTRDSRLTDSEFTDSSNNSGKSSGFKRLPAGTGPGTSGKPAANVADTHAHTHTGERDLKSSRLDEDINGPSGVQHGQRKNLAMPHSSEMHDDQLGIAAARVVGISKVGTAPTETSHMHTAGQSGLADDHQFGHGRVSSKDAMPSDQTEEQTSQLKPVTHERVRHVEVEEVSRVKDHDRHIHHVQHHTQHVTAAEELAAQTEHNVVPVTTINEMHTNKPEDSAVFEGQVSQHRDTLSHLGKERTVVDKGTVVNEKVHHHVHHIIQPVIQKETVARNNIHTTIPIHEITHEAPIIHQSQEHAPVALEHFLARGGSLSGTLNHNEINGKVMHSGQCAREVEGVAEHMERDLNLGEFSNKQQVDKQSPAAAYADDTSHPVMTSRN